MSLRQWHGYIGAFIAPSVLFFAFTGILQIFHLHEARPGYQPPPLIEKLGAVHKDQEFKAHEHHGGAGAEKRHTAVEPADDGDHDASAARATASATTPDTAQLRIYALKWMFTLVAVGLIASTLIGLWMGFTAGRRKGVLALLFLVGAAAPILLLAL